ncbi:hypothetical protein ES702_04692 [subsurface metagenome]
MERKSRREYKNQYHISLISFFDILGFKDVVDKSEDSNRVLQILETLRHQGKPDINLASMFEQKHSNISDTIVRTIDIYNQANKKHRVGILFHELLNLMHVQRSLIYQDIVIRGSITIGKVYHDGSYVFGPGFNRAYLLEKNIAIYPRIIIDRWILNFLEETHLKDLLLRDGNNHFAITQKEYMKSLVRESSDGVWFLDYLKMSPEFNKICDYGEFLRHHKELIVERSKGRDAFDRTAVKYGWLARYHNEVLDSMSDRDFESIGISRKNLHITKDEVEAIYEF